MHIMFISQCYAPEEVSGAVLVTELANDLVNRGHKITFITGAPSYPYGKVFQNYKNRLFQSEWLNGVHVFRTWSYITPSKSFWSRILHYGTFCASAIYGGFLAGKPELIVSYSPPLPLGLSAWLLSFLWQIPWILQIEDLYPDAAIAAGVLKNKFIINFFTWIEYFQYKHASHISVISDQFRKKISLKGNFTQKISVIPVWADPDQVHPLPKQNGFRKKHGLINSFVVMYAGNLGLTSCLEDILDVAELMKNNQKVRFVIIGEGVKKEYLVETSINKGLDNLLFLPFQPREIFAEILAAADVGLVTINCDSAQSSLPSKIFNIMASSRPILAIAPQGSEVETIINCSNCGIIVSPQHPAELQNAIETMEKDSKLIKTMGKNGRSFLVNSYSRSGCVSKYEAMLLGLCRNGDLAR